MERDCLVKLSGLTRTFDFGESKIQALDGINMSIKEGEYIVILGPSGAGKTTLLNMIGGIDIPTTGTVVVDNQQINTFSKTQLNTYRRNKVGWVFQFFNIVDSLRAWENVGLALEFQGNTNKKEIKALSYEMLEKVGLKGKELRFPSQLSGGEQQRVGIARALVKKPKLIVADEPTGNLDYITGQKIAKLMQTINKQERITFIVVSHDISITQFAQRVYHLKMGKIEKISEETENSILNIQEKIGESAEISEMPKNKKITE